MKIKVYTICAADRIQMRQKTNAKASASDVEAIGEKRWMELIFVMSVLG